MCFCYFGVNCPFNIKKKKWINQSYPTTTVIFFCISLLIYTVFTRQSQHCDVAKTLGKNEVVVRAWASRPALQGPQGLDGSPLHSLNSRSPPSAPPFYSEPNVLDESQGLLQEGNLSRYSGPLSVCLPLVRSCICPPAGGASPRDGLLYWPPRR